MGLEDFGHSQTSTGAVNFVFGSPQWMKNAYSVIIQNWEEWLIQSSHRAVVSDKLACKSESSLKPLLMECMFKKNWTYGFMWR